MKIHKLSSEQWKGLSKSAHMAVFNKVRPPEVDRSDFVYFVTEDDKPFGYISVKEMDSSTAYLQFGGVVPDKRGSVKTYKGFVSVLEELAEYKNLTCFVENTNRVFIKMLLQLGFLVVGTRTLNKKIFVDFIKEENKHGLRIEEVA